MAKEFPLGGVFIKSNNEPYLPKGEAVMSNQKRYERNEGWEQREAYYNYCIDAISKLGQVTEDADFEVVELPKLELKSFYCSNTEFGGKSCSKQCRSCRELEQEPEPEDFSYDVE